MPNVPSAAESFPTYTFLGLQFQFVATFKETHGDLCLLRNVIAPGLFVPLHSHADPEVFHVLEGEMELYQDGAGWSTVHTGDVLALGGGIKHALRCSAGCVCMTATGSELVRFFQEATVPFDEAQPAAKPTPEQFQKLMVLAQKWNMSLFSPEENAAIGIHLA